VGTFLYNLGRRLGPQVRKARWIWASVTGTQADAVKLENEVGRDLAYEMRAQLPSGRDASAEETLRRIGCRLAGCVANRHRTFSFEAVGGGPPNAYALPGGFIFVTQSLLELCRWDEDEVAFVLAHEMAHVIRGHAMKRIVSNSAISAASRITPMRGPLAAWLRSTGIKLLENAYSQDLESQADRLGVRLAAAARFDPRAAITLLSRLARITKPPQALDLGTYFSSHPPYDTRIRDINNVLGKHQA